MTSHAAISLLQGGALTSLVLAAATDLKTRTIPNELVLCVIAAGISLRLLTDGLYVLTSIVTALGVFAILATLAYRSHIGGGDAKLISASVLLVEPSHVLVLITAIALSGGVLASMYIVGSAISRRARAQQPSADGPGSDIPLLAAVLPKRIAASKIELPYGVAILAGVSLTLLRLS